MVINKSTPARDAVADIITGDGRQNYKDADEFLIRLWDKGFRVVPISACQTPLETAAPDLLEALQDLMGYYSGAPYPATERAKAAIEKAKA